MLGLGSALTTGSTKEQLYSLSLDGTGDYLSLSDLITTGNNMSFSAWINRAATGNMAILSKHDGSGANILVIGLYDSNKFHVRVRAGTHSATTYTTLNEWKHVVVTLAESGGDTTAKMYLDGDLSWTQDLGANVMGTTTGKPWSIGQEWDGDSTSDHFNGKIDDVAMWNVTLDDDAVAVVYNSGKPFNLNNDRGNYDNASALQGYWRMGNGLFDDKANGVVHDAHNPGFGSELVSSYQVTATSSTSGTLNTSNTSNVIGGAGSDIKFTNDSGNVNGIVGTAMDLVLGKTYQYSFSYKVNNGTLRFKIADSGTVTGGTNATGNGANDNLTSATDAVYSFAFRYTDANQTNYMTWFGNNGVDFQISNVTCRELNGFSGLTAADATFSTDTPDD